MSIGMMTPAEASISTGDRDMKWTSYRELAIKRIKKVNIAGNSLPLNPCHGSHSGYALQSTHDRDNRLASKLLSGITKEKETETVINNKPSQLFSDLRIRISQPISGKDSCVF